MKTPQSLKEIERRAYRSTFADGIYDILFGTVFLILAWIPVLEAVGIPRWYGYLCLFIPVALAWLGKRYITVPRLGVVEFGTKRRSKRRLLALICVAIFFLIMPLLIMLAARGLPGVQIWMAVVPIAALLIAMAAYFMDYPRLYLYAAVIVYSVIQAEFLYEYVGRPVNSLLSFGIPGFAILVFGFALLFRFINKYPKPAPEAHHVSR